MCVYSCTIYYSCMCVYMRLPATLFFLPLHFSIPMLFHTQNSHNSFRYPNLVFIISFFLLFLLWFSEQHSTFLRQKANFLCNGNFKIENFPFPLFFSLSFLSFFSQHLLPLSLPSLYTRIVRFFHSEEKNYMENSQENSLRSTNTNGMFVPESSVRVHGVCMCECECGCACTRGY